MRKTILVGIVIASAFIIGVLSANPVADAMAGWKFALDEHARDASAHHDTPESQVYEVSALSLVPAAGGANHEGNPVQLRCEDGDWLDNVSLSFDVVVDDNADVTLRGGVVVESNPNTPNRDLKPIGWDGRAEQGRAFQSVDIPVTITALCLSPVS